MKEKQRKIKESGGLPSLLLLALACGACTTAPQQNSVLFVHAEEKRTRASAHYLPAPNVLPELCSSSIQAHTIGDRLYWLGKNMRLLETQKGMASWYGVPFHGRQTANGETYNMHEVSAAHKSLPLPSLALVTNLKNGKSIVVRINDRGPFYKQRIIDLSYSAAQKIDMVEDGVVPVKVQPMGVPIQEDVLLNYFTWSEDHEPWRDTDRLK